jgi:hypothetical protein
MKIEQNNSLFPNLHLEDNKQNVAMLRNKHYLFELQMLRTKSILLLEPMGSHLTMRKAH